MSKQRLLTEPFEPNQWCDDNTYYQILLVTPQSDASSKKYLKTTLITKTKGEFKSYSLDEKTQEKLKSYQIGENSDCLDYRTIGGSLPSPGVVLNEDFLKVLFANKSSGYHSTELNNFYDVFRTLLHTRKISQLIAKTWHCLLDAKQNGDWENFIHGNWKGIDKSILDGLIARDLFLFATTSEPDELDPPNLDIYYPLKTQSHSVEKGRFLILPSSKGWQSLGLSLLMAGQVYYEVDGEYGEKYYHQVSQPILSTGEIVTKYALNVEWEKYKGDIKELDIRANKSSPAYLGIIPYPPIPSEINLSVEDIKHWAEAQETEGDLPFYVKDKDGKYLIGTAYQTPPYPYIPLSCT